MHSTVPYNVRELLEESPLRVIVTLVTAVCLTALAAILTADAWKACPSKFLWRAPAILIVASLVIGSLVVVTVPTESLFDLVGSPVLGIPPSVETLGRFVALHLGVLTVLTLGVALPQIFDVRKSWPGLVVLVAISLMSYFVVIPAACTDNLVELLRGGGNFWSLLGVTGYLLTAGATSYHCARLCLSFRVSAGKSIVYILVGTLIVLPILWGFFLLATNPAVTKYGLTFAASQFLLSPGRDELIFGWSLFSRFCVAQIMCQSMLACGMAFGLAVVNSYQHRSSVDLRVLSLDRYRRKNRLPKPSYPRSVHYSILACCFAVFAIYGSLIPFDYCHLSLTDAFERFLALDFCMVSNHNHVDFGANTLLSIPLSYCAIGVLLVDRADRRIASKATALVLLLCLVFSTLLEFAQVWFPSRTASPSDIFAQFLGAMTGCTLWVACGQKCTEWVRRYSSHREESTRIDWLLEAYFLCFCAYSIVPLDITVDPVDLYRKYRSGNISLLPFQYVYGTPLAQSYAIVTDIAVYLPLGALFTISQRRLDEKLRSVRAAVGIGLVFSICLELLQLFIRSRVVDVSDVLLGSLGIAIGASLTHLINRSPEQRLYEHSSRFSPSRAATLSVAYLVGLCVLFWAPFNFDFNTERLYDAATAFFRPPFSVLYSSDSYTAMNQWIQKTVLFAVLGAAIMHSVCSEQARRTSIRIALCMSLGAALLVEMGQLFLLDKNFEFTDFLVCGMGGALGVGIRLSSPVRIPY